MSEIQAYWLSSSGDMNPDPSPDSDSWCNYNEHKAELSALREELAIIKDECIDHVNLYKAWTKQRDEMQQRLIAAEQRNAEVLGLLRDLYETVDFVWPEIDAALKPTESGASE